MSDPSVPTPTIPDPQRLHAAMNNITEQSRRIMQAFVERQANSPREFNPLEPAVVSKAYQALWQQMLTDPRRLVEAQVSLWQGLREAVGEHGAAAGRRGSRPGCHARTGGPPVQE